MARHAGVREHFALRLFQCRLSTPVNCAMNRKTPMKEYIRTMLKVDSVIDKENTGVSL